MELQQILEEIGLSPNEVRVYLGVLELGKSTVSPIAKKAKVKRTYCYDILDSLVKKGLVTFVIKNNRRRYSAEDPRKLQYKLNNQLIIYQSVLPELTLLYNKEISGKPKVRFYDGEPEIAAMYEELAYISKVDAVGSPLCIEQYFGKYLKKTIAQVMTENLRVRELIPHGENHAYYHPYYKKPYHEYRFLPAGVKLKTDMMLFENKVALVSYGKELHAVVIEDSNIVDTQKVLFEILWSSARPLA